MPYNFDEYVLDTGRRELRRGAELIDAEPQVFDLLLYLIENQDRVVSGEELFDAVWQGRIVSLSTLTSRINAARRAIGDSGAAQKLIKTIPRKGYRFAGEAKLESGQFAGRRASRKPLCARRYNSAFAETGCALPMPRSATGRRW